MFLGWLAGSADYYYSQMLPVLLFFQTKDLADFWASADTWIFCFLAVLPFQWVLSLWVVGWIFVWGVGFVFCFVFLFFGAFFFFPLCYTHARNLYLLLLPLCVTFIKNISRLIEKNNPNLGYFIVLVFKIYLGLLYDP